MRDRDWSAISLGAPQIWPSALKTLVELMLAARQPMFIAWGAERTMLYNDAYVPLLGRHHPGALGSSFQDVWAEVWEELSPLVAQVFAGEPVHSEDITLVLNRFGVPEECHFAFSYTPVRDDGGTVSGLFCACMETTQQIMAERALVAAKAAAEDANLAKSTFIANMSHELRTPLSAIIGYSEMLIEELTDGADPSALTSDMKKIEGNARHLLGLINDVLDLSKIESGKMEVYAETFEIETMVRDAAAAVQGLVDKKGNALKVDLAPKLGSMHSDVTKIRQVILNFIGNAAKFTQKGAITLSVDRAADPQGRDWVTFRVTDSGIGMTGEQLTALFQRFQQADASTTRRFGGTGLGLSISKAFALMLGGDVDVSSTFGAGSTFSIRLPATLPRTVEMPEDGSTMDLQAATDSMMPGGRTEHDIVLVIDDDPAQRELMSRFLQREGFGARTAGDGATGLEMARALRPRAILLDVMMPGMDGWSVLSALKADPDLVAIPVVMVTFVHERGLASSLGASDYVTKPVQWERFRQVMDRFRDAEGDVLVVDDDPDTRLQIRMVLERDNWTVMEASNGQEALDHVVKARPRVVLLDLTMPIMDGFAFLRAFREQPGCSEIPVVVLTARDLTREDRRKLAGANQVLNKGNVTLRDIAQDLRTLADPVAEEPDQKQRSV